MCPVNQSGKSKLASIIILILGFSGVFNTASGQQNSGPTWSVTPYLWGSQTKVDLTFRDTNIAAGEISFSDLIDILDAAFMVQVEGGQGNWSAFGDLTYLKTSDTNERDVFTIDSKSEQTFMDAAIAYWPAGFGSQFSIFGGLRYTNLDDRFAYTGNIGGLVTGELRNSSDYYDALVGLRYRFDFSDRWQLLTHGDYGFGDSEGVFLLRANFAYTVGKRQQNRVLFGYQYKDAEYKDSDLTTAFINHGPMVGFDFRF
jgi:hypothetical protein